MRSGGTRLGGRAQRWLAALAMAFGTMTLVATPAQAGGGVDLQRYGCNLQAPGTSAVIVKWNVYGWRCKGGISYFNIDVNRACKAQYGSLSSAYYTDYGNPYSWRCR